MSAPDPATPRVLFVGGLGRSGSTLLELLLAQSAPVGAGARRRRAVRLR